MGAQEYCFFGLFFKGAEKFFAGKRIVPVAVGFYAFFKVRRAANEYSGKTEEEEEERMAAKREREQGPPGLAGFEADRDVRSRSKSNSSKSGFESLSIIPYTAWFYCRAVRARGFQE